MMGIKWAPLNVPLSRRIQTVMALFWIVSLVIGGPIGLLFATYLLFYTRLWPLVLTYFLWMYIDRDASHQGGRRSDWFRRLPCWRYYSDFFPIKLKKTVDLNPEKNYMFCVYPHGLLSAGVFGNFATEASDFQILFPGLVPYCATLDMHFKFPFFRDYIMAVGAVASSKESIRHVLRSPDKGKVLVLIVGGAAESLYAHPGNYRIILRNRKGFVKMAIKCGSPLVPVFSFGENELYDQVPNPPGSLLHRIQNYVRKFIGIGPCLPIGRGIFQYSFGPVPMRSQITTVVGKPIEVPHDVDPSNELINKYHTIFTEELTNLFNTYKSTYLLNSDKINLEIE